MPMNVNAAECWWDFDVEFDMESIDSRMNNDLEQPTEFVLVQSLAFVVSSDLAHNMAYQPN